MAAPNNNMKFLNDNVTLREYYRNSANNIEDPIFTGFTLSIDKEHSPLFFSLAGSEVVDTLVSESGVGAEWIKKEEEMLRDMNAYHIVSLPDSYEINTIEAKNLLGSNNDRRGGYGIFNKYYMDNVLYGAADYIYMVDRDTEGTFTDDYGVADIGDGTPNDGTYEYYSDLLSDVDPEAEVNAQAVQHEVDDNTSKTHNVNIFFNNDKTDIRPDQRSVVDGLIKFMTDNPDCTVYLEGYASLDGRNDPDYSNHNMDLSENRCITVMDELMNGGIDQSRITYTFLGDTSQPFTKNEYNRLVVGTVTGDFTQQSSLALKVEQEQAALKPTSTGEEGSVENNPLVVQHEENQTALDAAKKKFYGTDDNGEYLSDSKYNAYQDVVDKLKTLNSDIDDQMLYAKVELQEYVEDMEKYMARLKTNSEDQEAKDKIEDIYSKFEKYIKFFGENANSDHGKKAGKTYSDIYNDIYVKLAIVTKDDEAKFRSDLDALKKYEESNVEYFKKALAVTKTQITGIGVNDDARDIRLDLMDEKEKLSKILFGVHKDGRIGTESNPAEGSLCYDYLQAMKTLATDEYSQQEYRANELKTLSENYNDVVNYDAIQKAKKQVERNPNLPSSNITKSDNETMDQYADRVQASRNSRVSSNKIPQTVLDMLGFVNGMLDITNKYPYVLQTINGLDEAYKKYFDLKDPYMGSGDGKITINCLEFLDMRVTSMFNKYFNAVYDRQYRRERVPINLRRFQCSIFVHDIRNFKDTLKNSVIQNIGDVVGITEFALNHLSVVEFKFFDCEIVPEETGSLFDTVTNLPNNDMRGTTFTFTYGNCIINFVPFEDVRRYILGQKENKVIRPQKPDKYKESGAFTDESLAINDTIITKKIPRYDSQGNVVTDEKGNTVYDYVRDNDQIIDYGRDRNVDDGNFRRWFDRSEIGNVNNNDYRDYIRHDSAVAVDDHYKSTIVNDFAMGSVSAKNRELTQMDDALRRIVVGIAASTGVPTEGVADALDVKFIKPILTEQDKAAPVIRDIGNVNNSKVVDVHTMEYIGEVDNKGKEKPTDVKDLGKVK